MNILSNLLFLTVFYLTVSAGALVSLALLRAAGRGDSNAATIVMGVGIFANIGGFAALSAAMVKLHFG